MRQGAEILCESIVVAAKKMCISIDIISKLANKKREKSKGKGGDYAGQLFTARFRDE